MQIIFLVFGAIAIYWGISILVSNYPKIDIPDVIPLLMGLVSLWVGSAPKVDNSENYDDILDL